MVAVGISRKTKGGMLARKVSISPGEGGLQELIVEGKKGVLECWQVHQEQGSQLHVTSMYVSSCVPSTVLGSVLLG
jgi:hypothetical protein